MNAGRHDHCSLVSHRPSLASALHGQHQSNMLSSPRLGGQSGDVDPHATIRKTIVRRVEVPFMRAVNQPTQVVQLVSTIVEQKVPVRKLVQVPGFTTVNESYIEYEDREAIREKEVWVKKIVPEKYVERCAVQKFRQIQKPTNVIREVDSWEVVAVPTTKRVVTQGFTVREVPDSKVVEVEEEQTFALRPELRLPPMPCLASDRAITSLAAMATSFSSILPADTAASNPDAAAAIAAAAADKAAAKAVLVSEVGGSLYAKLNFILHTFPAIDELGLVLSMPSGVDKKGAATGAGSAATDALARYDALHPPPASLLSLQAENCAPLVVMESSKLGIAFWCIPLLVRFTMLRFQALRARIRAERINVERMTELGRATLAPDAANLTAQFAEAGPSADLPLPVDVLCCTRVLLLINADNYTAWNARKLLLSTQPLRAATSDAPAVRLLTPEDELRFLNLVYSKHPKSGESWSHRRWVLSRVVGYDSKYHFDAVAAVTSAAAPAASSPAAAPATNASSATSSAVSLYSTPLFQAEISMCERSAELYPKNYYAWMHRQWLVERITDRKELETELVRVGEWTESHINDYCGFFHRQVIWTQLLHSFAVNPAATATSTPSKGDDIARVHATLPLALRHWSKKFPQHDFVLAAEAAAAASPAAASSHAVAAPASAFSPTAGASSAAATAALHASLARCSFCSLFSSLEWSHLNELQVRYPGHESLWMYRRFVWHAFIAAIQQHAAEQQPTPVATASSSSWSSAAASSPALPSWLLPLVHRELEYAEFQIADTELSNWAANRTFALLYKAWVLHSALTLVYHARIIGAQQQEAGDASHSRPGSLSAADAASFPLLQHLSAQHRTWYLSVLQPVNCVQPPLMAREHWQQRTHALSSCATSA